MNINCVICSDLFDPVAEVFITKCGHMFHYTCLMNWLARAKTCPQCRNKVTDQSIHRVYFNLANTDASFTDVGTLVNKVENLQFQITVREKDFKTLKETADKYKKQNIGLRQEISDLEYGARAHESAIHALKDQMSYFKNKARETDRLNEEIVKLKTKITELENVQIVVNGSRDQVNEILRNESNVESLVIYAAMLKKSLLDADLKKKEAQFSLKKSQNEATRYKREYLSSDAKYSELKREMEHLKSNYDKEKVYLRKKIAELVNKLSSRDSLDITNTSVMRIACESPVNFNKTPKLNVSPDVIDLNDSVETSEKGTDKGEADSPYLPVKSSAVGIDYSSFLNTKFHTSNTCNSKQGFSIFKPSGTKVENVKLSKRSDITYNGLGGSTKDHVFPSPKPAPTTLKRRKTTAGISSQKFKKLAPPKTTKVIDYINLHDSQ